MYEHVIERERERQRERDRLRQLIFQEENGIALLSFLHNLISFEKSKYQITEISPVLPIARQNSCNFSRDIWYFFAI